MVSINWPETGRRIAEAMMARGVSAEWVAHRAGIDRKTVDRLRSGKKVRFQSLSCIEGALEISLLENSIIDNNKNIAPNELGGYSKSSYEEYIGDYFMFRRSYDFKGNIICSNLLISWNYEKSVLEYQEKQANKRGDGKVFNYTFNGLLSIPPGLSVTHFIGGSDKGLHRLITATSLRGNERRYFKGILLGINELTDIGFYPATSPVFIIRKDCIPAESIPDMPIGSFPHEKIWYKPIIDDLDSIKNNYAAF